MADMTGTEMIQASFQTKWRENMKLAVVSSIPTVIACVMIYNMMFVAAGFGLFRMIASVALILAILMVASLAGSLHGFAHRIADICHCKHADKPKRHLIITVCVIGIITGLLITALCCFLSYSADKQIVSHYMTLVMEQYAGQIELVNGEIVATDMETLLEANEAIEIIVSYEPTFVRKFLQPLFIMIPCAIVMSIFSVSLFDKMKNGDRQDTKQQTEKEFVLNTYE